MMTRDEYDELYDHVMGKGASREACRQGWDRWQAIWDFGAGHFVIHPPGEPSPPPPPQPTDYYLIAACDALHFVARVSEQHFRRLPGLWEAFSRDALGRGDRSAAREFLRKTLVDGDWLRPKVGAAAMGACIAWLISGADASSHHMLGYDIAYVWVLPVRRPCSTSAPSWRASSTRA